MEDDGDDDDELELWRRWLYCALVVGSSDEEQLVEVSSEPLGVGDEVGLGFSVVK